MNENRKGWDTGRISSKRNGMLRVLTVTATRYRDNIQASSGIVSCLCKTAAWTDCESSTCYKTDPEQMTSGIWNELANCFSHRLQPAVFTTTCVLIVRRTVVTLKTDGAIRSLMVCKFQHHRTIHRGFPQPTLRVFGL